MTTRAKILSVVGLIALLSAAGLWLLERPRAEPVSAVTAAVPGSTPRSAAPLVVPPSTPPQPVASVPENPVELAATARMYAAHAPLRVPEVADPDSATNKQILQTMVFKALHQPAAAPGAGAAGGGY